jgi:membrane associated rhomboid family serine protease
VFPYRDENETIGTPLITLAIIAANALAWLLLQGAGAQLSVATSVCILGLVPGELTLMARVGDALPMGPGLACAVDPGRQVAHVFTAMFLHGSWMHLLGNMWFLWVFGNNVEDSMGHARYLVLYLICGVAAALAQVAAKPDSIVPMVGASGAIGGVMGAYLVLYPRVKVYNLVFVGFYATTVALPAWVMLGYWMLLQVLGGAVTQAEGAGVAYAAHVGGFAAGALLVKPFTRSEYVARRFERNRWG